MRSSNLRLADLIKDIGSFSFINPFNLTVFMVCSFSLARLAITWSLLQIVILNHFIEMHIMGII